MPSRRYAPDTTDRPGSVVSVTPDHAAALPERGRIMARGVIERITIAPVTAPPEFTALARIELGGVRHGVLINWMGRRRVPGISAGVELRFEGMLSRAQGAPTVYNPRYEIIGRPEEP